MNRRGKCLAAMTFTGLFALSSAFAGALHDAARSSDAGRVNQLIAQGADVNEKDRQRYTPLHSAASSGNVAVAELLIARGAEVNAKDWESFTPLHNAAFNGHRAVVALLIARGADVNATDYTGLLTHKKKKGCVGVKQRCPFY